MFEFLVNLPKAEPSGSYMKGPDVFIDGFYLNNALVSRLRDERNEKKVNSYVIGIQGRGTLNIPEAEFDDLLACLIGIYRERQTPVAEFTDVPQA